MSELTHSQQAAAFHGLASNLVIPTRKRLSFALIALNMYEAEVERLCVETERLRKVIDHVVGETL